MTIREVLNHARARLAEIKEIEDPGLESEVLLRHVLQYSRAQLFSDLKAILDPGKMSSFNACIERRLLGEPLAYITNSREFYGLEFFVDKRVLIPRPETELLVEEAIRFCNKLPEAVVADLGTGSGAIAVALAINSPQIKIYAIDVSSPALSVARINTKRHGVEDRIIFIESDLLTMLQCPVNALIANLPYVRTQEWQRMPSAGFEPRLALDGGAGGLDQVFRLIDQLKGKILPHGYAWIEIGLGQSDDVGDYLKKEFPGSYFDFLKDLAGIERVVKISL